MRELYRLRRRHPGATRGRPVRLAEDVHSSSGWLRGQASLLPRAKSAFKGADALETAIEKYSRQTGARGFARSRAVQDDLFVEWHRIDVPLEFARRNTPRTLNHVAGSAVGLLAAQIDHENVRGLGVEQRPELRGSDARNRIVANQPTPLVYLPDHVD